jgi:tRNA pseudouridine38-40 synthase
VKGETDAHGRERGDLAATPGAGAPADAPVWRLDLAYDGTAYRGWARQPEQATVQETLEEALAMVLREPVRLSVAGRTDAGVHAWAQVASFACGRRNLRPDRLRHSLNAVLPPDIAVQDVSAAPPGFEARRARSRTYQYRLWTAGVKPVRDRAYVWDARGPVDTGLLLEAASLLPGHRDFSALTPSARLYRSCVREVTSASWRRACAEGAAPASGTSPPGGNGEIGQEWIFEISAGSFLHNMVRVAVGSMVDVAQGRMALEELFEALQSGERWRMGQTAPACGLALTGVAY